MPSWIAKRAAPAVLNIVARSKGKPNNLAQRDKTRLKNIAGKAIRG